MRGAGKSRRRGMCARASASSGAMCTNCDDAQHAVQVPQGTSVSPRPSSARRTSTSQADSGPAGRSDSSLRSSSCAIGPPGPSGEPRSLPRRWRRGASAGARGEGPGALQRGPPDLGRARPAGRGRLALEPRPREGTHHRGRAPAEARPGRSRPRGRRRPRPGRRRDGAARRGRRSPPRSTASPASGSSRWASNPAETSTHVGAKPLDRGRDDLVDGAPARRRPVAPAGSGTFSVVPGAPAPADLRGPTGAGIRRPLVRGHVQHPRVVPEELLGAVAVVHVPVDDERPAPRVRQRRGRPRRCC